MNIINWIAAKVETFVVVQSFSDKVNVNKKKQINDSS